jgi:hypothetical protein
MFRMFVEFALRWSVLYSRFLAPPPPRDSGLYPYAWTIE